MKRENHNQNNQVEFKQIKI